MPWLEASFTGLLPIRWKGLHEWMSGHPLQFVCMTGKKVLPYRCHSLSRLMNRHGFWCGIFELLHGARHLRVYVSLCTHVN